MPELKPFLVTAPLNILEAGDVDTNTIYVFDYIESFKNEDNKPDKFITYLESLGGMVDMIIDSKVAYEEKEQLILRYFNAGSFFNIYTLVQSFIHILFIYKGIEYYGRRSIFTDGECEKFILRNKIFMKTATDLYNSLFLIMLLYSIEKDMKKVKNRYTKERFINDELSPNLLTVMLDSMFYEYYTKHIGKDLYYYTFLFDNRLYKNMPFDNILTNDNNNLLPVMFDLGNEKFQKFLEDIKK